MKQKINNKKMDLAKMYIIKQSYRVNQSKLYEQSCSQIILAI